MSDQPSSPVPGTIGWCDLTVDDADGVRDFYKAVVGWEHQDVPMKDPSGGDYADYAVGPKGNPVAGVCHKRGGNAGLPSQWLLYFVVENLDASIDACLKGGGEVIAGPKTMGASRYAVMKDPAGAVSALYQP